METEELKKLVGKECLVIDPRSKTRGFEPATIIGVHFSVQKIWKRDDLYENISYEVKLHRVTVRKKRFRENIEYNRSFTVSGNRIRF